MFLLKKIRELSFWSCNCLENCTLFLYPLRRKGVLLFCNLSVCLYVCMSVTLFKILSGLYLSNGMRYGDETLGLRLGWEDNVSQIENLTPTSFMTELRPLCQNSFPVCNSVTSRHIFTKLCRNICQYSTVCREKEPEF